MAWRGRRFAERGSRFASTARRNTSAHACRTEERLHPPVACCNVAPRTGASVPFCGVERQRLCMIGAQRGGVRAELPRGVFATCRPGRAAMPAQPCPAPVSSFRLVAETSQQQMKRLMAGVRCRPRRRCCNGEPASEGRGCRPRRLLMFRLARVH